MDISDFASGARLKKNYVVKLCAWVFVIFSSIVTANGAMEIFNKYLYEPFSYKQTQYKDISELSTETNINYFRSKLGDAAFINSYKSTLKEYIFVNVYYYVQAITDANDKVLAYSVTTRDKNFNPRAVYFDIYIGKSTFRDLGANRIPEWLISYLGAHDYFYTEGYWQGNPGGYQTFFFSSSMTGYSESEMNYKKGVVYIPPPEYISKDLSLNFGDSKTKLPDDILKYVKLNDGIINTYTVLGPFVSVDDIKSIRDLGIEDYLFGPDQNQVRLLEFANITN